MKLLLTFLATICYVSAGKWQRMMAAMNAGMIPGMNGVNPGMMGGGLNSPMAAGGGAGFMRQLQFPQFFPAVPALAVPGTVPNMYSFPAGNALPYMGIPQLVQMNPPQQPQGVTGGAVPQQAPAQPDALGRFRRQIVKQGNAMKTNVDTQIPAPTDTVAAV